MSSSTPQVLMGTRFGVIADAHIHPGHTPAFPDTIKQIFAGADVIFALGDMGESSGLDWLQAIAPVIGARGLDDPKSDTRVAHGPLVFSIANLTVGAVFDGVRVGLFSSSDPLELRPDFLDVVVQIFGRNLDVLLYASTHKPFREFAHGVLLVNPGSPTLADRRSIAILQLTDNHPDVDLVYLDG
jgi:predicted phosphodiesterase